MAGIAPLGLSDQGTIDGDMVIYPDSLLFKAGDYPDRRYSMTPDEIRRYAEDLFDGPVPNELEHVNSGGQRTILDGKLGEVRDVWASDDGTELRGTVAIPRWLDAIWGGPAKKISAAWDRSTKAMKALGLVLEGRVPEAALMSAYAAFAAGRGAAGFAGTGTWKVGAARNLPLLDDLGSGWDGQAAEDSIFGDGDTIPADARRGFLIYDASAADLKGSYKLPFAKREGGRLKASRAGLRNAASRLPQTDAPQSVLDRARAVIDGYQAKFQKDQPESKDKAAAMAAGFAARIRNEDATQFMQEVHDSAAEMDPEVCMSSTKAVRPKKAGRSDVAEMAAKFADYPQQLKAIKRIHDMAVEHGASCPGGTAGMSGTTPKPPRGRSRTMGLKHALGRLLYGDQAPPPDVEPDLSDEQAAAIFAVASGGEARTATTPTVQAPVDPMAAFADSAAYKEMKAELDRQKALIEANARRERERAEAELVGRAATFAKDLVTGDPGRGFLPRITPAALEAVTAIFAQAIRDDAASEVVVTFAVGDRKVEGGRVAALEALFAALPGHTLLAQTIAPQGRIDPAKFSLYAGPARDSDGPDPEILNRMRAAVGLPAQNGSSK